MFRAKVRQTVPSDFDPRHYGMRTDTPPQSRAAIRRDPGCIDYHSNANYRGSWREQELCGVVRLTPGLYAILCVFEKSLLGPQVCTQEEGLIHHSALPYRWCDGGQPVHAFAYGVAFTLSRVGRIDGLGILARYSKMWCGCNVRLCVRRLVLRRTHIRSTPPPTPTHAHTHLNLPPLPSSSSWRPIDPCVRFVQLGRREGQQGLLSHDKRLVR